MTIHDTLVVGWDENGNTKHLKSFEYSTQEKEAQEFLKFVIDNSKSWSIGELKTFKIEQD